MESRKKTRIKMGILTINGRTFSLYGGLNLIGRHRDAIVIIKDVNISQQHAVLTIIDDENHFISDFNSSNGTSVGNIELIPFELHKIDDDSVIIFSSYIQGTYKKIKDLSFTQENTINTQNTQVDETLFGANTQLLNSSNISRNFIDLPHTSTQINKTLKASTSKDKSDSPTIPDDGYDFSLVSSQISDALTQICEISNYKSPDKVILDCQSIHEAETQVDPLIDNFKVPAVQALQDQFKIPESKKLTINEMATQIAPIKASTSKEDDFADLATQICPIKVPDKTEEELEKSKNEDYDEDIDTQICSLETLAEINCPEKPSDENTLDRIPSRLSDKSDMSEDFLLVEHIENLERNCNAVDNNQSRHKEETVNNAQSDSKKIDMDAESDKALESDVSTDIEDIEEKLKKSTYLVIESKELDAEENKKLNDLSANEENGKLKGKDNTEDSDSTDIEEEPSNKLSKTVRENIVVVVEDKPKENDLATDIEDDCNKHETKKDDSATDIDEEPNNKSVETKKDDSATDIEEEEHSNTALETKKDDSATDVEEDLGNIHVESKKDDSATDIEDHINKSPVETNEDSDRQTQLHMSQLNIRKLNRIKSSEERDSDGQTQLHTSQLSKKSSNRINSDNEAGDITDQESIESLDFSKINNEIDVDKNTDEDSEDFGKKSEKPSNSDADIDDEISNDTSINKVRRMTKTRNLHRGIVTSSDSEDECIPKSAKAANNLDVSDSSTDIEGNLQHNATASGFLNATSDMEDTFIKRKSMLDESDIIIPSTQDANTTLVQKNKSVLEDSSIIPSTQDSNKSSGDYDFSLGLSPIPETTEISAVANITNENELYVVKGLDTQDEISEEILSSSRLSLKKKNNSSKGSAIEKKFDEFLVPTQKIIIKKSNVSKHDDDEIFDAPTQKLNSTSNQSHIDDTLFDAPTQKITNKDDSDTETDFLAPTQKLTGNICNEADLSNRLARNSDDDIDFSAPTQKITRETEKFSTADFDAPTQKISNDDCDTDKEDDVDFVAPTQKIIDNSVFDAPTQKIGSKTSDFDFSSPTQKLSTNKSANIMKLNLFTPTHQKAGPSKEFDDDDFIAPTQKLGGQTQSTEDYNYVTPTQKLEEIQLNIFEQSTLRLGDADEDSIFFQPTQAIGNVHDTDKTIKLDTNNSEATQKLNDKRKSQIFLVPVNRLLENNVEPIEKPKGNAEEVESQLEVMFATQTVHLVNSDNNRPSNPLAAVLKDVTTQDIVETLDAGNAQKRCSDEMDNNDAKKVKLTKKEDAKPKRRNARSSSKDSLLDQNDVKRTRKIRGATNRNKANEKVTNEEIENDEKTGSKRNSILNYFPTLEGNKESLSENKNKAGKSDEIVAIVDSSDEPLEKVDKNTNKNKKRTTRKLYSKYEYDEDSSSVDDNQNNKDKDKNTSRSSRSNKILETKTILEVASTSNEKDKGKSKMKGKRKLQEPSTSNNKKLKLNDEEDNTNEEIKETNEVKITKPTRGRKKVLKTEEDKTNEEIKEIIEIPTTKPTRGRKKILKNEINENIKPTRGRRNTKMIDSETTPSVDSDEIDFQPASSRSNNLSSSDGKKLRLKPKVVFTMLDSPELCTIIKSLGGTVVDSIEACTVLVTKNIARSLKLLSAVAQCKPICSPDWLQESKKAKHFLDPWDHLMKDTKAEEKWIFSLEESFQRSKSKKLFSGYFFQLFVTEAAEIIKGTIESAGGKCVNRVNKSGTFVVIASVENKAKCTKYIKQNITIALPEAVFDGVLRQEIVFDKHLLTF